MISPKTGDLVRRNRDGQVGLVAQTMYLGLHGRKGQALGVIFPNTGKSTIEWLGDCTPVLNFADPRVGLVGGLPENPVFNRRTCERGHAVRIRTWRRRGVSHKYVDVRIDIGSGYVFKTWLVDNCGVLVNVSDWCTK
jgi:hypothetical protein